MKKNKYVFKTKDEFIAWYVTNMVKLEDNTIWYRYIVDISTGHIYITTEEKGA